MSRTQIGKTHQAIAFQFVEVGEEFLWGSYYYESSNYGKKKSSKTAEWQMPPKNHFQDDAHTTWSYFRKNEIVYVRR